jgi:putative flavoprotein involved in K+ transport
LAGRNTGHIPFRINSVVGRRLGVPLVMFLFSHVLSVDTPIGRRLRPRLLHHAGPVVRVKPKDLAAAAIERVPRIAGVRDGRPVLADQRVVDVANVIWCTGFCPDFSWIDLPVFTRDDDREPRHELGIVPTVPGLCFVGLFFLSRAASSLLLGVGRDAARIADTIAMHTAGSRTAA